MERSGRLETDYSLESVMTFYGRFSMIGCCIVIKVSLTLPNTTLS